MPDLANAHLSVAAGPAHSPDLRRRIGWICHALRAAALIWIVWAAANTILTWSDKALILDAYAHWLAIDVAAVSNARYGAAFAFVLISLASAVPVVVCLWRLVGTYLAGRVFTVEAAIWLRRTAIAGLTALAISILVRPIVASILASKIILLTPRGFFLLPQDLLHLVFVIFVLALAYIFKAAAEMAEDHAQIV